MRPPSFWSKPSSHPAARLLGPVGCAYGALTAARMDRPGIAAPCPVICIGNFTLGGAGKTPTAIRVAAILHEFGRRPAFLTRGYGGRLPGPILVGPEHSAHEVGDEPLLLARHAPTIVARDRPAGAAECAAQGAGAIVMDDGFQNPSLDKDLALVVADAGAGIGNGLVVPAGPLRVPLGRQWPHVGALVLIGEGSPGDRLAREADTRGLAVHRARLVPDAGVSFTGRRVLAFAGIGRPAKFFESLREAGARIVGERVFADHHPYRDRDLVDLSETAARLDASLVTTEKDRVRLPSAWAAKVETLKVALAIADETPLRAQLAALFSVG